MIVKTRGMVEKDSDVNKEEIKKILLTRAKKMRQDLATEPTASKGLNRKVIDFDELEKVIACNYKDNSMYSRIHIFLFTVHKLCIYISILCIQKHVFLYTNTTLVCNMIYFIHTGRWEKVIES